MNKIELNMPMIMPGPCALETRGHAISTATEAKKREIEIVRLSLYKPRTKPNTYDGAREKGLPWLVETAQEGIIPATEVLMPKHAESVVNKIIKDTSSNVLIWLGSRNQNQDVQQEVAGVIKGEPKAMLMIKNQLWEEKSHWEGIIEHVLAGGASKEQIILCHRGFAPGVNGYRNKPNFEMAMDLKKETGLPMLIDPSHIGGSVPNVLKIAEEAIKYEDNGIKFDGLMIEVHPNPNEAKTDKDQQLMWTQLDGILKLAKNQQSKSIVDNRSII